MSDCVYVAWAEAARDLGVEPGDGSRTLFELSRSLFGEPKGLWAGAAPLVVGLLCRMHDMTLTVIRHPWFDTDYYEAAAGSEWQRQAVALWKSPLIWKELETPGTEASETRRGAMYFWLGGHHTYYSAQPKPGHFITMTIELDRRPEGGLE